MTDDFDSMRPLKGIGNSYFQSLFDEEKKVMTYSKQLAIGRDKKGKVFYLDCREAFRGIFIGPTRSGKTWLIRAIVDRWKQGIGDVLYLTDVKNEFYSSRKPLQPQFHHLLLPGESPVATNVITLRPSFFEQIDRDGCPKFNSYYSVNMGLMSKADFLTLMNADASTALQQNIFELIYDELSKEHQKTGIFSFDTIDEIIDSVQELNATQKLNMKFKFRPIKSSGFYKQEYERDIISLMNKGFIPAINVRGFDQFGKGSFDYPSVFIKIVAFLIVNARRQRKIKEVLVLLDESPRFVPIDRNSSSKAFIMESVDVDTAERVNYLFGAQSIEKVPDAIVKQSRYIFLPANVDLGTLRTVLMSTGLCRNIQSSVNDSIYLRQQMSAKRHEWLCVDKLLATKTIFTPLAPLSWHLQSGE